MGDTTLLKVIAYQNPGLLEMVRGQLTVAPHVDARVLKHIHFRTHSIQTSLDPFYDNIAFIAASLAILSPESIHADCKVRSGVCAALGKQLGMSQQLTSYYIPHARHYYAKNPVFRETVDGIVRRYK